MTNPQPTQFDDPLPTTRDYIALLPGYGAHPFQLQGCGITERGFRHHDLVAACQNVLDRVYVTHRTAPKPIKLEPIAIECFALVDDPLTSGRMRRCVATFALTLRPPATAGPAVQITRQQFSAWCDDYTEAQLDDVFAGREYLTPLNVMDLQESISTRLWAVRRALPLDVRREICVRGVMAVIAPVAGRVKDPVFSAALAVLRGYLRDDGYIDSHFGAAARGLRAYARRVWGDGTSVRCMALALVCADAGLLWRTHCHAWEALHVARAAEYRTFDAEYERIVREVIVQRGL